MFEIPDLASLSFPDNRREAAVRLGAFALLVIVVCGGVTIHEYANSNATARAVWMELPWGVRYGLLGGLALMAGSIAVHRIDVVQERRARARIGVRPRDGEQQS
jgi:uncharacterized membrane protein YgdD (TMEM256/DUF423 family)